MKTILLAIAAASATAIMAGDAAMDALRARAARLSTDERIQFYRSLVTSKPDSAPYQVLLASAFLQKMRETTDFGYVDRASKLLNELLVRDATNYEALELRTQVHLEYHRFKEAADLARQLIKIAPKDPMNWGTLADALMEMGDYDAAADAIQTMADLRPDLASYNRAAHYRFLHNDAAGAIEIMKSAVDAGSNSPENVAWCLVELGDLYFKTGRMSEARSSYEAALKQFPGSHKTWGALARLEASEGETKPSIEHYRKAQSMTPLPDYAAALSDLYTKAGMKSEALRERDTIDLIDRLAVANNEKANRNLAIIFSDHDWKLDRALQLAEAELDVRRDVYTYDTLAWALFKNGKVAEAREAMTKAMALGTPEPQFAAHAKQIFSGSGSKEYQTSPQ